MSEQKQLEDTKEEQQEKEQTHDHAHAHHHHHHQHHHGDHSHEDFEEEDHDAELEALQHILPQLIAEISKNAAAAQDETSQGPQHPEDAPPCPTSSTPNLDFYANKMACYPEGDFIDTIHSKWHGQYEILENHLGYQVRSESFCNCFAFILVY